MEHSRAMARWSESRGYTLILTHPRGPDRYARVALVNKRTLFGLAYNVREARAEDATRSGREPEALGFGRMLSWRWLGESEADELLAARLRTLETLGYTVHGEEKMEARGPWDWLRDLVQRQLERPSNESEGGQGLEGEGLEGGGIEGETRDAAESEGRAHAALGETLARLGLEPEAVLEGLATILELDEAALREPDGETLRALEPELLAMLLPVWLEHESRSLRAIGQRWLELPATLYELDLDLLERWAGGEGPLARALAERLELEGLALLGPETLARLSHTAADPQVKAISTRWRERLRG